MTKHHEFNMTAEQTKQFCDTWGIKTSKRWHHVDPPFGETFEPYSTLVDEYPKLTPDFLCSVLENVEDLSFKIEYWKSLRKYVVTLQPLFKGVHVEKTGKTLTEALISAMVDFKDYNI